MWTLAAFVLTGILCIHHCSPIPTATAAASQLDHQVCRTSSCNATGALYLKTMDLSVDPCEDFHQFACGNVSADSATIWPKGMHNSSRGGHYVRMQVEYNERRNGLLENLTMDDLDILHQFKRFHTSCLEFTKSGRNHLRSVAEFIHTLVPGNQSLAKTLATIYRSTGKHIIFEVTTSKAEQMVADISLEVSKLPFSFFHNSTLAKSYSDMIITTTQLIGQSVNENIPLFNQMSENSRKIIEFGRKINFGSKNIHATANNTLDNSNDQAEYEHVTSLANLTGTNHHGFPSAFDLQTYLETVFHEIEPLPIHASSLVRVKNRDHVNFVQALLNNTNLKDVEIFIVWNLISAFRNYYPEHVTILFEQFDRNSQDQDLDLTDIIIKNPNCESLRKSYVKSFAASNKYFRKYVDLEIIEQTSQMADNVKSAFYSLLENSSWMDSATKTRALSKLENMGSIIGFPKWVASRKNVEKYYEGLKFNDDDDSYFNSMMVLVEWETRRQLTSDTYNAVRRNWPTGDGLESDWITAIYIPSWNVFAVPLGMLERPYTRNTLRAADYGALGSRIGHEIAHGFGTIAKDFDENGLPNPWWTNETQVMFANKAKCLTKHYDQYKLTEFLEHFGYLKRVNGRRTLEENMADIGGIRAAYNAHLTLVKEGGHQEPTGLPGLEEYSPEQLFFISYAQSECSYITPDDAFNTLIFRNATHSPPRFRILGPLSNIPEFSQAWQCNSGSRMNPVVKCDIWG